MAEPTTNRDRFNRYREQQATEAERRSRPAELRCWNAFCIAGDCDGENHVDVTGRSWHQAHGESYCVRHNTYDDCEPEGIVFTDYDRHEGPLD